MADLDLEVVIVSHGAEALLRRCLASLRAHPPRTAAMRVTVVDSGSPDGTPDMVEREFPEFRLRAARQHRLLGGEQPGAAARAAAARCCC